MKKIIGMAICVLMAIGIFAGCSDAQQLNGQTENADNSPVTIGHWITKELADDGLKKYTGNLEIYLNDDSSAFIRFRDYNVTDYGDEGKYQVDENGDLFEVYELYYTWKESFNAISFEPMDANDYYLTANNEVHYNRVVVDANRFYISKGKIKNDGTMEIAFGFNSSYEQGHRGKNDVNFILEQTNDLSGVGKLTTEDEVTSEQTAINQSVKDTDRFCRAFIAACPRQISQFRSYNSFEETYDSFWFGLTNASVLYSDGAVFAVVDVSLYPEYAESGSITLDLGEESAKDIEVVRNENNDYSLLYAPDDKPANEIIDSFVSLPEDALSVNEGGKGVLRDFFYRSGSWEWRTYELMAASMVGGSEDTALFYVKENDWLVEDYPIEVPASKLRELSDIIDKYNIRGWKESYEAEEEIADGDGFLVSLQYDNDYHISSGYMSYPDNYGQAQAELDAFFAEMREQHMAEMQEQQMAGRLENVTGVHTVKFSFGNYMSGATIYEIKSTDEGYTLSYGGIDEWVIEDFSISDSEAQGVLDMYNEHNVFSWYGYDKKVDGESDFVFLNDLFVEEDGNLVHFSISGIGDKPEGWKPFQDDLSTYLNDLLGI